MTILRTPNTSSVCSELRTMALDVFYAFSRFCVGYDLRVQHRSLLTTIGHDRAVTISLLGFVLMDQQAMTYSSWIRFAELFTDIKIFFQPQQGYAAIGGDPPTSTTVDNLNDVLADRRDAYPVRECRTDEVYGYPGWKRSAVEIEIRTSRLDDLDAYNYAFDMKATLPKVFASFHRQGEKAYMTGNRSNLP